MLITRNEDGPRDGPDGDGAKVEPWHAENRGPAAEPTTDRTTKDGWTSGETAGNSGK